MRFFVDKLFFSCKPQDCRSKWCTICYCPVNIFSDVNQKAVWVENDWFAPAFMG